MIGADDLVHWVSIHGEIDFLKPSVVSEGMID